MLGIAIGFLALIAAPSASQADDVGKLAIMPGFTLGARSGMMPRVGLDLAILNYKCIDACQGYGVVAGMSRSRPFEYYIGVGAGVGYFFAAWFDATLNFVEDQYTGVRVLGAFAPPVLILPFVAIGYDKRPDSMYIEAGIIGKIPIRL